MPTPIAKQRLVLLELWILLTMRNNAITIDDDGAGGHVLSVNVPDVADHVKHQWPEKTLDTLLQPIKDAMTDVETVIAIQKVQAPAYRLNTSLYPTGDLCDVASVLGLAG